MDNDGFYSFHQNAIIDPSINPYQDNDFTAAWNAMNAARPQTSPVIHDQVPGFFDETGAYILFENLNTGNPYAFDQSTLPQPAVTVPMNQSQYAYNQLALPQQAVTNAFDFNRFPTSDVFNQDPAWATSTSIDQQAFEQTLTETNNLGWLPAAGANSLSGDTTVGRQTTLVTGSHIDAPFELNQSDKKFVDSGNRRMDGSLICSWPGCVKTAPFKSIKLLETHLENIHVNPLVCTQPNCSYTRPFSKKGDLDRHLATRHGIGRLFKCPQRHCWRHDQPFGRKDKLREYIDLHSHGTLKCTLDHCKHNHGGLLTKQDLASHVEKDHGKYECDVGSCEGSKSKFSLIDLKTHFQTHLSIYIYGIYSYNEACEKFEGTITTVTTAKLSEILKDLDLPFHIQEDCWLCKRGKKKTSV